MLSVSFLCAECIDFAQEYQIHSFFISLCSLRQILLQSEEELLAKRSPELVSEGAGPKPKKIIGKMKVQGVNFCVLI